MAFDRLMHRDEEYTLKKVKNHCCTYEKTIYNFYCLNDMEPEVRDFLQKIVWSLSATLLWLLTNTLAGLKFEFAIFDKVHIIGNIIFYSWFFISFFILYRLLKSLWKNHL